MKKVFAFMLSVLMLIAFTVVLVGCPSAPEKKPAEPAKKEAAAAPAPGHQRQHQGHQHQGHQLLQRLLPQRLRTSNIPITI